jgi:hypothetical protein
MRYALPWDDFAYRSTLRGWPPSARGLFGRMLYDVIVLPQGLCNPQEPRRALEVLPEVSSPEAAGLAVVCPRTVKLPKPSGHVLSL